MRRLYKRLPRRRREHLPVPTPSAGLRYDLSPTMIEPQYTPNCNEITLGNGELRKAKGTRYFVNTSGTPLGGIVMKFNWVQNATLMAHTTTKVYELGTGTFTDLTDGGGPYSGDADNRISSVWMNSLYIWNNGGADVPRKYNLSDAVAELTCGNRQPGWIHYFGGRLCMYNVDSDNLRVRWSTVGDPETYNANDYADLDSEFNSNDVLQRAERFGNYTVIFGKYAMASQQYMGDYTKPFAFQQIVPNVGLAAPDAVMNYNGKMLIFLSWDGLYMYAGGREVTPMFPIIRDQIMREIDPKYINRSFITYIQAEERMRLHFPSLGSTIPDAYLEYNFKDRSWTRGSREYTGWGPYVQESAVTWNTIVGTWDEQTMRWDDRELVAQAPLILYGNSSGNVILDADSKNLLGSAFTGTWESKDFVQGPEYRRSVTNWMKLTFEGRGDGVDVSYSTDGGQLWTALETTTLTEDWASYEVDFEVNTELIRFKFENGNVDETFAIRYFEVGYLSASVVKEEVE